MKPQIQPWSHFAHEADIGIRGYGETREEAFTNAALALTAVVTDPANVRAQEPVSISCTAPDDELLLLDWLNALIYEMATRHMLFSRFAVTIDGHHLQATAWGEAIDIARHQPAAEIKAATFCALAVQRLTDGQWLAQCVVDV